MVIKDAYKLCTDALGKTDGRILFEGVTNYTFKDVLTHGEKETDIDFNPYIKRVLGGEPIQYVLGETEFMSLKFKVTPAVLIPRQDTETLVEWAIKKIDKNARVLDLCTGSGCIAISVKKYTHAFVTALDISEDALKIAEQNASLNNADITFIKGDAHTFDELENLDFVLSNPPYIESEVVSGLDKKVKDFEPRIALDGGKDGLDFYTDIAKNSRKMLKNGGFLAVEIGYNQAEAVSDIFNKVFGNSTVLKDLCGNNRVVYSKKQVD
ncbi:MAG: peptide chain release factor N(5)-glutamine methyltransferase [Clostridia bacterium]|nr:peptide chain release factor N(5)-glutamine methyltransferase [Clostridia bacterium]